MRPSNRRPDATVGVVTPRNPTVHRPSPPIIGINLKPLFGKSNVSIGVKPSQVDVKQHGTYKNITFLLPIWIRLPISLKSNECNDDYLLLYILKIMLTNFYLF